MGCLWRGQTSRLCKHFSARRCLISYRANEQKTTKSVLHSIYLHIKFGTLFNDLFVEGCGRLSRKDVWKEYIQLSRIENRM